MTPPIIVIGASRSGTSMVSGVLHSLGCWVGKCREADKHNPLGYFENKAIHELRRSGLLTIESVVAAMRDEGYGGGPWLVKHGPYFWNDWPRFGAQWVFVRRPFMDVCVSRIRRGEAPLTACSKAQRDFAALHSLMKKNTGIEVWSARLVHGDYRAIEKICTAYGLRYDPVAIKRFIRSEYWHVR